jgi:branched-chain amino acid transport system substrate-binding protein
MRFYIQDLICEVCVRNLIICIILTACCSIQAGCKEPEPIRIGFLGDLTARAAGLSTSGRDGFLLAIEEINAHGGINNRQVEGLVQDTKMHTGDTLEAVRKLVANHVSAIIGPMTSQAAVTIVPEINRTGIPTISPTVSTNQLAGLDDYFFRVYYTNAQAARLLAGQLASRESPQRITAIYDLGNRAYTEDWIQHFQEALEQNSEAQVTRIPFDLRSDTLFLDLAVQAAEANPQGILILANAVDTALICQQLAKTGVDMPIYATGWSYSDDLIQFGGRSVEGLTIIQSAGMQDPSPKTQAFVKAFQKRYNSSPNFPALHAYDATSMVLSLLEKTTDPKDLREELLKMKHFTGLQSDLALDRYGDMKSPRIHLARIESGQFVSAD